MIYVDLDNTLIDSVYRQALDIEIAVRYGLSKDDFYLAEQMVLERCGLSDFGYDKLFQACKEIKPDLDEKLHEDWVANAKTQIFFPDTLRFLGLFQKEELTLLTTGNINFQSPKIDVHGLTKFFSEIKIVASPKSHHISPPTSSVFIDDSPREIDAMKERFPYVFCILIRSIAPWEKQKTSLRADIHCPNLLDAVKYIK